MQALYRYTVYAKHQFASYHSYGLAGFFGEREARAIVNFLSALGFEYAAYRYQDEYAPKVFILTYIYDDDVREAVLLMFDRMSEDAAICDASEDAYFNFIASRGYAIEEWDGKVLIHFDNETEQTEVYETLYDALCSLYPNVEVFY